MSKQATISFQFKIVIVAIPGESGGIGRTLVEAFIAHGNIQVNRKSRELGVSIIEVDFSNVDLLKKVLEDDRLHTVISGLCSMSDGGIPPEMNPVRAAQECRFHHRFIASNQGFLLDRK